MLAQRTLSSFARKVSCWNASDRQSCRTKRYAPVVVVVVAAVVVFVVVAVGVYQESWQHYMLDNMTYFLLFLLLFVFHSRPCCNQRLAP